MRQLILDLLPEAPPTFDNFVAGSNEDALTGLAAWLAPVNREPSLLLWGEAGSGKTHLLRASNACFSDASINPDLSGIDDSALFHAVDNVETLSAAGQIALFNLFNRLRDSGRRLLLAASSSPRELPIKLADLISNTQSIVANDPGFARIYLREKASLMDVLREGDPDLWASANRLLQEGLRTLKLA